MSHKEKYITASVILAIFLAWYGITEYSLVSDALVPSPKSVAAAFFSILSDDYKGISLWRHLSVSMIRLLTAFLLAALVAVPLGLASGYNSKIRAVFEPIVEFYRPLPPLAYYTLIILWMGIDDSSKITLLWLAAFAPMYIACVSAMRMVKNDYVNSALTLGASKWQVFFYVSFPACLPGIFTGIRTAVGVAYTTLVAAEMVAAVSGIGWLVLDASRYLRSDIIFMGIFIMGITGITLDQALRLLESKIVFWKGKE
ncbi:MAG: ABC transporter permease subunit [Spirochaetaceae bacterium]|jgi:taurine transport system permease protein|nr:ABC transporter permease subunit [Spirochaetaceae bacterium]